MQTPNYFQDIADFHAAMPLPLLGLTGQALVDRLQKLNELVDEELLAEFMPAYANYCRDPSLEHLVTLIDAICDSIYVVGATQIAIRNDCLNWELERRSIRIDVILYAASNVYQEVFYPDIPQPEDTYCTNLCDHLWSYGTYLIGEDRFNACWREVHSSNMRKADGPVVNGKKMKPPGWVGPDLKSIIEGEKHGR